MRTPLYDVRARKKTVSVTINADLWEKARAAGLNLSEVAETAIAAAFVARERARIQAEIDLDLTAYNAFVEEHGSSPKRCASITLPWNAMRQFDVFANPIVRVRRAMPFVVLLQSDRARTGRDRVVAPMRYVGDRRR